MNGTQSYPRSVAAGELDEQSRGTFVSRTYGHLFGAVLAFTLIEVFLFKTGLALTIAQGMLSVSWLLVLGGFVVVSWVARAAAHRAVSKAAQYAALAGYVVAQALIFVPLLVVADRMAPGAISSAAAITFVAFTALTAIVFFTRKDFSFLRGILCWGGIIAIVLIIAGAIFGFQLGTFDDTSNVLHHYSEDRYVAAALELFASVALMLWYVLRLFLSRR